MKICYIKTIGFRKFDKVFETELYDVTNIIGKNRSGKSNILYAIINIFLGTNLSGDEKTCLINNKCDASYGELHFTDNMDIEHILIRGKHKYDNSKNFITLDGKEITQKDLLMFYKDKKLFLSILNPLYFLTKKPAEQKEMVDKYLSDIKPNIIFEKLSKTDQDYLIKKYFQIPIKEIYHKLNIEELENIYNENNLKSFTGKEFTEIPEKDKFEVICSNINVLRDIKYFELLSKDEKTDFINKNMLNICLDIAYNKLSTEEQNILEGIPKDIPKYITELNEDIKKSENIISVLDGKIEYAKTITNEKLQKYKVFEKEEELSLAQQELSFLSTNQDMVNKENQKKIVENMEKDILSKETECEELEKAMKNGKKKYLSIKNGASSICPTCEQHIQDISKEKTISNMKKELVGYYDRKNLLETQLKDLKSKLTIELCNYHALEGNSIIEKSKRITVVQENIKQLEEEQLEIQKWNNEIDIKKQNIANANADISKFNKDKQLQEEYIDNLNKAKKIAQKLYITYIEEKMKLAKHYLKDVNIKFYSVLKTTGEIKEDFIITYKNNRLSDLSKSEKIATALEFANMFNQISRSRFPIFIDDAESCADYNFIKYYAQNTQIFISNVKKRHPLTITDYNSNKATIIKYIITGYKTFKTQKTNNQIPNLPQVA